MEEARNFVCPLTEVACVEPTCLRDHCTEKDREAARQAEAAKRDLQRRAKHGLASAEELGL
jgi:hypothetical protein